MTSAAYIKSNLNRYLPYRLFIACEGLVLLAESTSHIVHSVKKGTEYLDKAQAVIGAPVTMGPVYRSQARLRRICGGKSGTDNFLSVCCVKQNHSWIVNVRNLIWRFECHWSFIFCCGWMKLFLCGTEASNGLIVHPLDARWMYTEQCWNLYLTCENLCQCHAVDHKLKSLVPGLTQASVVRNLRIITWEWQDIRSCFRSSGAYLKIYAHKWKCVVRLAEHVDNAL
jgi:hypothetical protein